MIAFKFYWPEIVNSMTIRKRFALAVLVVVLLIMSVAGIMRIQNTAKNINQEMDTKVATITELAALSLSDPLWNYNDEGMRVIGEALLKDPKVCSVSVTTNRGREVYKQHNEEHVHQSGTMIFAEGEITKNNMILGVVTIGFTTYFDELALQTEIWGTLFTMSLMAIILWFLISFISKMLTKPIYELCEGAEEVARGNLTKRLSINFDDEIGGLARKFNIMAEKMYDMMHQLENKNKFLEIEIKNREQTQQALAASEEKFFKAFCHVADVIGIVREKDRRYIEVNDAFMRVFGYERHEIIGRTSREIGLWNDQDEYERIYEILASERAAYNFEISWRARSGEMRLGLTSAEVSEISGESCIVYVWHDISDIRKAEEALWHAHNDLEIKVEKRTQELFVTNQELTAMNEVFQNEIMERKRAEEQLAQKNHELKVAYGNLENAQSQIIQQEKMASIGQLAAGVAHEINNPIGFIISNLDSLRGYTERMKNFFKVQAEVTAELKKVCVEKGNQEQIAPLFAEICEAKKKLKVDYIVEDTGDLISETLEGALRVKKIVQGLKGFARMNDENMLANLNEGIESTMHIIWNEIKYKASLTKELGDIPLTRCNPGQLNQVFMNLLVNAAQAIEVKGDIFVKTWVAENNINVSIRDTGSGIKPEALTKIFDPFYTTKEVGKGTGLGLSISYDIIKKHGGEIQVESEVGIGTIFTLKIPIVEE